MTNANELRMGSLIEKDNVMYKFLSLEQNHASTSEYRWYWVETLDGKLGKYYSSHFNPIPLTPEILEKCGFERQNYEWAINKLNESDDSCFCLFDMNYNSGDLLLELNAAYCPCPKVEHLHQLQNLYFSLTCEELTFKP